MGYQDIYELQALTGAKAKSMFLLEHSGDEWVKKFLYFALNPLISYNLSEKTLKNVGNSPENNGFIDQGSTFRDVFDCCEYVSRLRGIDGATLRQIQSFLLGIQDERERELYIKLLSKTIRLGVTAKSVNKVIPNLIPEWEVQQAYTLDKYPLGEDQEFWLTQKMNGVRATYYNGRLIARSGSPYNGLDHIIQKLRFAEQVGIVLDGELILKEGSGLSDNEAFRVGTGIINSDETAGKRQIRYVVFDAIPVQDFESANPRAGYKARRLLLDNLQQQLSGDDVEILPVLYHGADQKMIDVLLDKMVREDKEGLMVNLDVPYKRTRHRGILKVKRFYTMDLPIAFCEEGTGRLEGTLGSLVVTYNGNQVRVGSGFSDEQRAEFWANRENLPGMLCEVKYKEISSDKKTGMESLQFPIFVRIRDDKTEVSYY